MNEEKIDRYLRDELDATERRAFEAEIEATPEAAEALAFQQDVAVGARAAGRNTLKAELQALESKLDATEAPQGKQVAFRPARTWSAVAASAVILLVAGYFFLTGGSDPAALYQERYEPYPNVVAAVQRTTEADAEPSSLGEVMREYELGRYAAAARAFEAARDADPTNDTVQFYLGNCYLALEKPQEAERAFRVVTQDSVFYVQAQWYLALSLLGQDNVAEARTTLKQIEEQPYRRRAQQLLEEL